MAEVLILLWVAAMLWLVISRIRQAVRDRRMRRDARERGVYYGGGTSGARGAFFGGAALGGGGFDGGGGGGGCDGGGGGGC
ncbi:hypothetical protein [Streptomyces oceani]|uniref:Uncharacterized protein n=1 Tax=Streptomyces oceani TaxID=1075402 RepID=A0A1E7KHS5_9ACTN|nr:hypothetical protein [Streptomyces oceani]OEV03508.1 hypothetical protein AN216_11680 [Streptomyces oceani]